MTLKVSASHISDRWQLDAQPFAIVENGEYDVRSHRVGGDAANGYYAIATNFGCGRHRATPQEAIRELLQANGCTNIRVEG